MSLEVRRVAGNSKRGTQFEDCIRDPIRCLRLAWQHPQRECIPLWSPGSSLCQRRGDFVDWWRSIIFSGRGSGVRDFVEVTGAKARTAERALQ